jgi:chromate transporter
MGLWVCIGLAAITFVAIALLRLPLAWVLLVVGGGACLWAYRVLGRTDAGTRA